LFYPKHVSFSCIEWKDKHTRTGASTFFEGFKCFQ
jgi:hypothetical protein